MPSMRRHALFSDWGILLFKIARTNIAAPFTQDSPEEANHELLRQLCISEDWTADLESGIVSLGPHSMAMHGVSQSECGLLNLLRCYEAHDQLRILELFEQAATNSSSFCYSSTIQPKSALRQPVFCIGESAGLDGRQSGRFIGVFLYPRFKLDPRVHLVGHQ